MLTNGDEWYLTVTRWTETNDGSGVSEWTMMRVRLGGSEIGLIALGLRTCNSLGFKRVCWKDY